MKLISTLFLTFFVLSAFTNAKAEICPQLKHSHFKDLLDVQKRFAGDWNSVVDKEIPNAPCKTQTAPSLADLNEYLENTKSGQTKSETINGIKFENEDTALLKLFSDLNSRGKHLDKSPIKYTSSCTKVMCAIKEIFGENEGPKIAYMLHKYGYNGNHKIFIGTGAWTNKELDKVLMALGDLPQSMYPISYNHQFTHASRNLGVRKDRTLADATITFYGGWDSLPEGEKQSTIIHELGHNLADFEGSDKDEDPEWLKLSGWVSKRSGVAATDDTWVMRNANSSVSKYGNTNPAEDFAETVTAYRYNAKTLKASSPEKYEYMKNKVFDGIEYTSEALCQAGTRTEQKRKAANTAFQSLLAKTQKSRPLDEDLLSNLQQLCSSSAVESMLDKTKDLDNCIRENYTKLEVAKLAQQQGLSDLQTPFLTNKDWRDWPTNQATFDQAKKVLSKAYSQSMAAALLARGPIFDRSKPTSFKITPQTCRDDNKYAYQSIASHESFAKIKKQDEFFFYDRSEKIAAWAASLCEKYNSSKTVPLTEVISGELP